MRPALATIVDSLPDGVRCAALPTPFPVGPVNCYLLAEAPVTVIDPGMALPESLVHLTDLIQSAGLRVDEVDQVVVTHAHPDHFGAAGWLSRAADAPVLIGRAEVPKLQAYGGGGLDESRIGGFLGVLDTFGVPSEIRDVLPEFRQLVAGLVEPIDDDRFQRIDDGDTIAAGGTNYTAHVTPGHAAGHLSLHDGGSVLFAGDHLLPRISPNPFLEMTEADPPERRPSLIEYLYSLDRFVALDPAHVLPGHGEPFTDLATWTTRVRAHHDQRADEIADLVAQTPGSTVYELTLALFPDLDGFSIMLGLSEIAGHIDLLEQRGTVTRTSAGPDRYEPT